MTLPNSPPHGFRWIVGTAGRILGQVLALASLAMSLYFGYRYVGLTTCLQESALADQRRTSVIAAATDVERAADLHLLRVGGASAREAAIEAREATDRARAQYPAPDPRTSSCR